MSAPPVRIESKAWTDGRYAALALRLGLPNARFALILCAGIWRWQTEHYTDAAPTYSVERAVIEGELMDLEGPEKMVASGLAVLEPDGRYRIRGGLDDEGKSRIDWLYRAREQRRSAGRSRAAGARDGGRFAPATTIGAPATDQRAASGAPAEEPPHQRPTSGAPATDQRRTSSPFSVLRTPEDLSLCGERAREGAPAAMGTPRPPDGPLEPPRGPTLAERVCDRLTAARRKLDASAAPLDPMRDPEGTRSLLAHVRAIPEADRERVVDAAVDVFLAIGEAEGWPLDRYRLGWLAGPRNWPRWRDGTVAGARQRAGPARPAAPLRGSAAGRALVARLEAQEATRPQEPTDDPR